VQIDNTTALGAASGGAIFVNASALPTAANQRLGVISGGVVNTSGTNRRTGAMSVYSSEAWTDNSAQGTHIRFEVCPNGSASRPEVMRIDQDGNLLIGTTTNGMTAAGSLAIAQDLAHRGSNLGVFNTSPTTKQTVTGSRGANAALASLLTQLAAYGLITDSTS
jgi:hypothetical protein